MTQSLAARYDLTGRMTDVQHTVLCELDAQDDREILWVDAHEEQSEMSSLTMHLFVSRKNVVRIPAVAIKRPEDIMQWAYACCTNVSETIEDRYTVVVHLPRVECDKTGGWGAVYDTLCETNKILRELKLGYLFATTGTLGLPRAIYPPSVVVITPLENIFPSLDTSVAMIINRSVYNKLKEHWCVLAKARIVFPCAARPLETEKIGEKRHRADSFDPYFLGLVDETITDPNVAYDILLSAT